MSSQQQQQQQQQQKEGQDSIERLICSVQNYEWGRKGRQSTVGMLYESQMMHLATNSEPLDENKPYAEFWMGTHPSGPSSILARNHSLTLLSGAINQEKEKILGKRVLSEFGEEDLQLGLPFLFKVLSINKALSIQAHPHRELAKILHQRQPQHYRDTNHKPELAVALTNFEVLCFFRKLEVIATFLKNVPELRQVVGENAALEFEKLDFGNGQFEKNETTRKLALKSLYSALMHSPDICVQSQLERLVNRLKNVSPLSEEEQLILRLHKDFGHDVGCFSVYFLNYLTLKPGQAIFLAANEPHAYLLGDCVECMACSDNVVRAGLTPKFKDIDTLCSMLTYKEYSPNEILLLPTQLESGIYQYAPPVKEFKVMKIHIKPDNFENKEKQNDIEWSCPGASIVICLAGIGSLVDCASNVKTELRLGSVHFVVSDVKVKFVNVGSTENLLVYVACCNI